MVLGCIHRTTWGTKLLLTADLGLPCGLYQFMSLILKAQHCSLSPNGYFSLPAPYLPQPPTPPPPICPTPSHSPSPIDSICGITGTISKTSSIEIAYRISFEVIAHALFSQGTYLT